MADETDWGYSVEELSHALNDRFRVMRLAALQEVAQRIAAGEETTVASDEVNNHVHTIYSFSPYSPALAAYRAWKAGLRAVGCVDHDSVAGAEELIAACKAIGIGSTVGCEIRVSLTGTALEGRKLNSPDSSNIAYIVVHGIPRGRLVEVDALLGPIRAARNRRNERQVARLNELLAHHDIDGIDFERDVAGISRTAEGGSITERHILLALANRIVERCGKGSLLVGFLGESLGVSLPGRVREYLLDESNPHYLYDLLGVLKGSFLPQFFIQPDGEECRPIQEIVDFANAIDAIPAYPYLGDVGESPTGDKKAEAFEDSFLDLLFPTIKEMGFRAVTYMPPRNSVQQLHRIQGLCARYELMEISGVDINSSRQSFTCPEVLEPDFRHLIDSTWALIAHEKLASYDGRYGLFSSANPLAERTLAERMALYAEAGRTIQPHRPEEVEGVLRLIEERRTPWNARSR